MNNRRRIRESVLQAIYSTEIGDHKAEDVIRNTLKPQLSADASDWKFAESLYLRTLDIREEADSYIEKHIVNWEINRLAFLDRMILRMAICEMIRFEDIPPKVTINEAIEIAKKFSTAKSGRFVNGILDAVYDSLVEDGKVSKTGRGLIDHSPGKS